MSFWRTNGAARQGLPAVATAAAVPVPVLEIENLRIAYREGTQPASKTLQRVVHDVSLSIAPGEVLALVGESGSGKSTTAQAVIGLLPDNGVVESGAIRINGHDVTDWTEQRWNPVRGRVVSLIPQDPTSSLNPVRTVGQQVGEILRIHGFGARRAIEARVLE
ncbi:MAG: ABC transporter ATP-binding protein, partial [Comamonadaceae bacterium]